MPDITPKLVIVTPNIGGDTLTARATHDGAQIGKLHRGEVYFAVEEYKGMLRLGKYQTPFPFVVPPGAQVWADARFLPDFEPTPPDPEPIPADNGKVINALIAALEVFLQKIKE